MVSKAVSDALEKAFQKLFGRRPTSYELDELIKSYEREPGLLVEKAAESLRAAGRSLGRTTSDDNLDRVVDEIKNELKG